MQQLEVAPISDSLNVITELLGIKFNIYVFIEWQWGDFDFVFFVYVVVIVALCERSLFRFLYFMYDHIINI